MCGSLGVISYTGLKSSFLYSLHSEILLTLLLGKEEYNLPLPSVDGSLPPYLALEHRPGSELIGLPAIAGKRVEAKAHLSASIATWGLGEAGIDGH